MPQSTARQKEVSHDFSWPGGRRGLGKVGMGAMTACHPPCESAPTDTTEFEEGRVVRFGSYMWHVLTAVDPLALAALAAFP